MKKLLSTIGLSVAASVFLIGCGGGGGGGGGNSNNTATVTPSGLTATVKYDSLKWLYNIKGEVTVNLGSVIKQVNITSLDIQIGDNNVVSVPYSQTIINNTSANYSTKVAIDVNLYDNFLTAGSNRNAKIVVKGDVIGGGTYTSSATTVPITGFDDSVKVKKYSSTVTTNGDTINPNGETKRVNILLKDENGITDTTTRIKIATPSTVSGLSYPTSFTSNRSFDIVVPANNTADTLSYNFTVEVENGNTATDQLLLEGGVTFGLTQSSVSTQLPYSMSGSSGVESLTTDIPNISASGNGVLTMYLNTSAYNGQTMDITLKDLETGTTLFYYDIPNIHYGSPITFNIGPNITWNGVPFPNLKNTSTTSREILATVKIKNGATVTNEHSETITQSAQTVAVVNDTRTLTKTLSSNTDRYSDALSDISVYVSLGGAFESYATTDPLYKNFGFSVSLADSLPGGGHIFDTTTSSVGGVLWDAAVSSGNLNFNNSNLTVGGSNTVKVNLKFNPAVSGITSTVNANLAILGKDGSVINVPIKIDPSASKTVSGTLNYGLEVFPTKLDLTSNSHGSLVFNLTNETGEQTTPNVVFKLLNNSQWVTPTQQTVVASGNSATIDVTSILANTTGADITAKYVAYVTVNGATESEVVEGDIVILK